MTKSEFGSGKDSGLANKFSTRPKRAINRDGTFNIIREAERGDREDGLYHTLINMRASHFIFWVLAFYFFSNLLFSIVYFLLGAASFQGLHSTSGWGFFMECYFFGFQTLTTVGYGSVSPFKHFAALIASLEALYGILSFALATGLLYGRFSRPKAQVLFADNALVSPYKDGTALMIKVANGRKNVLTDLEVSAIFKSAKLVDGQYRLVYQPFKLEFRTINFMPLNWTIVHPIDENSPMWNKTADELEDMDAEILLHLKGFDDAYHQIIQAKTSYHYSEIVWGGIYLPSYESDDEGYIHFHPNRIHEYKPVNLK